MTTRSQLPTEDKTQAAALFAQPYEHEDTRALVTLVSDAAELVRSRGEAAFGELRVAGSRWRQGEAYVFVLDPEGNMLVHADPALEGRKVLELEDVSGKPIIRGLIGAATAFPAKSEGWYHYQWPVPGGLLPRWKSSYVRLVSAPSGKRYVVGSGVYTERMERAFIVDMVTSAIRSVETHGQAAFPLLRDPKGPFIVKDAYVFVLDLDGVERVNPAFPSLEGRNLLEMKDAQGKYPVQEMIQVVQRRGYGWVDYLWPRPGESAPTQKSAYVGSARLGERTVVVGCGVYLPDAVRAARPSTALSASELMTLVREGAAALEAQGERLYPELRKKGSRWFQDETYFFVWTMDGTRVVHAAAPESEGQDASGEEDALGRPFGRMILEVGATPSGEGWVHYLKPRPGEVFPAWKSTFVKRVTLPSGKQHLVGCGVYDLQLDQALIEDVVGRAAALIQEQGRGAFARLRDKRGPFVFMDTYVFVIGTDGTELVNAGLPGLEGRNLMDLRDLRGRAVVQDEIAAALREGSAWVDLYWFRPGDNTPARKQTYVRKVQAGQETFVVGSGIYVELT